MKLAANFARAKESGGFEALPAGDYPCRVVKVTDMRTKDNKKPLMKIEADVISPEELMGGKFFDNVPFEAPTKPLAQMSEAELEEWSRTNFKAVMWVKGTGIMPDDDGLYDSQDMLGKEVLIKTSVSVYKGKQGNSVDAVTALEG